VLYQNDDYGKDYLKGLKDGLGAKAASMIVAEESYETSEPTIDPYRQAQIERRRRVRQHRHAEIRGAGDQEGRRDRVEAASLPQQRVGLGRQRDQAGRLRKRAGHHLAAYLKDASDPQWDNDAGMKQFYDFLAKDFPEGNKLDASTVVGYGVSPDAHPGAQEVRRRPHPRKHHEAGGKLEGFPHRSPAARHQDQHQPDRFRSDQPASTDAVQGREMGAVRRHHQRDVGG
jgi:hypothetical protein